MRLTSGILSAALIALSTPAVVQAQATPAPGMQVIDTNGGAVGIVTAVKGENLLIKTDKHEALLPKASFTVAEGKLLFAMTQAQLDAEIEKSQAAASASIVAGASVKGLGGTAIGTIDSLTGDDVVIALSSGQKIQVAKASLRGNADGTATIGYTSEQLQALVAQSTKPADSSGATEPAGE